MSSAGLGRQIYHVFLRPVRVAMNAFVCTNKIRKAASVKQKLTKPNSTGTFDNSCGNNKVKFLIYYDFTLKHFLL